MTKKTLDILANRYLAGLRAHLDGDRESSAPTGKMLGEEAVVAGGDTLSLARIHDRALSRIARTDPLVAATQARARRAGAFFVSAVIPIEREHHANRELYYHIQAKAQTLEVHAAELAAGNRILKKEVGRRKRAEQAVLRGKDRYFKLFTHSHAMQKKLRHLARLVISAQEEERREISRELHDEVVQTLVGINVQLAALGQSSSTSLKALKSKIALTQRLVEKSVSAVHEFARELRPAILDDLGLIPALQGFMKKLAARKRIKIHLRAFAGVEKLSPEKRVVLYRVAQESLTNVGRHANATVARVIISPIAGAIRMDVHDNGKSFPVDKTLSSKTNKRIGLLGMRERVEMVGGTLKIDSAVGRGTRVRAEIPLYKVPK